MKLSIIHWTIAGCSESNLDYLMIPDGFDHTDNVIETYLAQADSDATNEDVYVEHTLVFADGDIVNGSDGTQYRVRFEKVEP